MHFIIPSFRSEATLSLTLDSIRAQRSSLSHRILVVDSSPTDPSDGLRERYPDVQLLHSPERLFPGAARNLGAHQTRATWIAFLDADAVVQPDWLDTLFEALTDKPGCAAGGWVRNANPTSRASRVLHWIEFSEYLPGHPSRRRDRLSTSNLLIRRADFQDSGGFDPVLAMSEDTAFFRAFGGDVYFVSGSGIDHLHRAEWTSVGTHLEKLGYWSGVVRARQGGRVSWLGYFPLLSYLLPFWRLIRILYRVGSGEPGGLRKALPLTPHLLAGLWYWASGFRHGIGRSGSPGG